MSSNVPSVVLRQASPSSHRAPDWSMPEKRDSAQSIRDYSYIAWEAFYRADLCHNHSSLGVGVQVRARWDPYWRTVIHVRCYNVRWFLYDECSEHRPVLATYCSHFWAGSSAILCLLYMSTACFVFKKAGPAFLSTRCCILQHTAHWTSLRKVACKPNKWQCKVTGLNGRKHFI